MTTDHTAALIECLNAFVAIMRTSDGPAFAIAKEQAYKISALLAVTVPS